MHVTCPGLCGPTTCGEQVEATGLDDFNAATVTVAPCTRLAGQGWEGPQAVYRKTDAIERLLPPATVTTWRHRDGLVTFTGGVL